jgi:ethanolamine ammonia-lyase small subunit
MNIEKQNQWQKLKEHTNARVALGSVGIGMPLSEVLALKLAHAQAKDAIETTLDSELLKKQSEALGVPFYSFKSKVRDRKEYLKRPDLGRCLDADQIHQGKNYFDIIFVLTDGLSAEAVNQNAFDVLKLAIPKLINTYSIAIAVVEQGRVAIGDELSELFHSKFTALFIGERPGLSSPVSMGIYTTYEARAGFTDEKRNCISNIHQNGLSTEQASILLNYLIVNSFELKISGVNLKIDIKKLLT